MERLYRSIASRVGGVSRTEGAGVDLVRAFGPGQFPQFLPFLQFDEIRSDDPKNTTRGFPWHPHCGIVTFTYIFEGRLLVESAENTSGKDELDEGSAQVVFSGRGVMHQEMPLFTEDFWAIQLWLGDTPQSRGTASKTQNFDSQNIPVYRGNDGLIVKVLSGEFRGNQGPVEVPHLTQFLDIHIPPFGSFTHYIPDGECAFVYVLEGTGEVLHSEDEPFGSHETILLGSKGTVSLTGAEEELRIVLCAGTVPEEPLVWEGPMAAGTKEELDLLYRRIEEGTFPEGA